MNDFAFNLLVLTIKRVGVPPKYSNGNNSSRFDLILLEGRHNHDWPSICTIEHEKDDVWILPFQTTVFHSKIL